MNKIKLLPIYEAQKIAAGEVVERPANVVKELVENALDAGATHITISMHDAGSQSITIIDDGCGMSEEDAQLCVQQYATSKIDSVDQLSSIHTFGFRGEALASIAAVSKLTITTKEHDAPHGITLLFEQGNMVSKTVTSSNNGTTILIENLFYNVPARKKFLKKRDTEWRQITHLFNAFCFDYIQVGFTLMHDEKLIYHCPAAPSLQARLEQLWETRAHNGMLEINHDDGHIKITGLISHAHFAKYDRSSQFFFVNKRWVKNHALSKALMKGYLNVLPPERYPACVLFIDIDPTQVDINIHPRKEEIQFLHPRIIETKIQDTVRNKLESTTSHNITSPTIPTATPPATLKFDDQQPTRFFGASRLSTPMPVGITPPVRVEHHQPLQELPPVIEAVLPITQESLQPHFSLIGQYHKTYLLLDRDDGMYLIDQHAAHERILYEQFSQRFGSLESIPLLFPQLIELKPDDVQLLEGSFELLAKHGIMIDTFNEKQIVVQAVPVHAKNISMQEFIMAIIGWLNEYMHVEKQQLHSLLHEKLHAQMACKAAIKAGDTLTHEQMIQLLEQLNNCANRFTCPHGRPTGWLLPIYEIEKKFKRKL